MKKAKEGFFQVKLKLHTPSGYKSKFIEGLVAAPNEQLAKETAVGLIVKMTHSSPAGEPVQVRPEVFRIVKLRSDFILTYKKNDNESGADT